MLTIRNKESVILRRKIDRFFTSEVFISFFYRLILFYSWTFRLKIENVKLYLLEGDRNEYLRRKFII